MQLCRIMSILKSLECKCQLYLDLISADLMDAGCKISSLYIKIKNVGAPISSNK
jgi:hypothetical protein